jgi:hypothetical protein
MNEHINHKNFIDSYDIDLSRFKIRTLNDVRDEKIEKCLDFIDERNDNHENNHENNHKHDNFIDEIELKHEEDLVEEEFNDQYFIPVEYKK